MIKCDVCGEPSNPVYNICHKCISAIPVPDESSNSESQAKTGYFGPPRRPTLLADSIDDRLTALEHIVNMLIGKSPTG